MRTAGKGLVAAAVFLLSGAGRASAGSITAVMAPATAMVGSPVTITIQGVGPPCALAVNYNTAGTTVMPYTATRFPFSLPAHTYAAPGTKTIMVTASGTCTGRVMTTISISAPPPPPPTSTSGLATPSSLQHLCALVPCTSSGATALNRPTLTEVLPSSMEPGQALMISGFALGASPGAVRLRLPNGTAASVTVTSWTPFTVTGTLDGGISGVSDGNAQVVVQRSDNVLSNALTVPFVAARQIVQVPPSLVSITTCSDAAVTTVCHASTLVTGTRVDFGRVFEGHVYNSYDPTASFSGLHRNYWDDFGCSGADQYAVRLPAGWVVDSFHPSVGLAQGATFHASVPPTGRSAASVVANWTLAGGDSVIFYGGWFFAAGPRGMPLAP